MNKLLWAICSLSIIVAVVLFLAQDPDKDVQPLLSRTPPNGDLTSRVRSSVASSGPVPGNSSDASPQPDELGLEVQTEVAEREFAFVEPSARLDESFESEDVDFEWASRVESEIYRRVADSGLKLVALDAECRSNTCRLTLTHHSNATEYSELEPLWAEIRRMSSNLISDGHVASTTIDASLDASQIVPVTKVYLHRTGANSVFNVRLTPQPLTEPLENLIRRGFEPPEASPGPGE